MKTPINLSDSELERFAGEEWMKVRNYLRQKYDLPEDDCRDIYQESLLTLYENIQNGKLTELTASLSCYFISICRNKALEHLRRQTREETVVSPIDYEKVETIIDLDDTPRRDEVQRLVRKVVEQLPEPCAGILWGFYRDGLSLSEIAMTLGYSGANTVKVLKHRCINHFNKRFREMYSRYYD